MVGNLSSASDRYSTKNDVKTNELNALLAKKDYAISSDTRSNSKLECSPCNEPLAAHKDKATDPGKFIVRVTSYRRRLIDYDNLAEKYHIDALRYAGLIPSDAPDACAIITNQIKVKTKEEELTLIEICLQNHTDIHQTTVKVEPIDVGRKCITGATIRTQ